MQARRGRRQKTGQGKAGKGSLCMLYLHRHAGFQLKYRWSLTGQVQLATCVAQKWVPQPAAPHIQRLLLPAAQPLQHIPPRHCTL